jgi:hypothetical protein
MLIPGGLAGKSFHLDPKAFKGGTAPVFYGPLRASATAETHAAHTTLLTLPHGHIDS